MRQLTSLGVQFLAAQDGRTHGHVSAVSILEPATAPDGELTLADITRVFHERLHLLPPLRWRPAEVPLGLDYPRWLDDPDFDLEFHLRELYLPPPGNLAQLAEQVSRIVSRPLDRARPLWECPLRPATRGSEGTRSRHDAIGDAYAPPTWRLLGDARAIARNESPAHWRPPYPLISEGVTPPA